MAAGRYTVAGCAARASRFDDRNWAICRPAPTMSPDWPRQLRRLPIPPISRRICCCTLWRAVRWRALAVHAQHQITPAGRWRDADVGCAHNCATRKRRAIGNYTVEAPEGDAYTAFTGELLFEDTAFATKPELASRMIHRAVNAGVPAGARPVGRSRRGLRRQPTSAQRSGEAADGIRAGDGLRPPRPYGRRAPARR